MNSNWRKLGRKSRTLLGILLVLSVLVAGCSSSAPASSGTTGGATGSATGGDAPAEGPRSGGDLVIAFPASSEPASLDGQIDPYQPAWLFDSFVADPLVVLGPDGAYHPALAERWEVNDDATEWTFYLKEGVIFQDNTPFNAEAVKYNLDRIKDPATQSALLGTDLGPIREVEVVDDLTVRIHYDEPWVTVLEVLRRAPMWSPTAAEEWGLAEFDKHLVGAGPFTMEEWVANDRIVFRRWEDYGGWNSMADHEGPAYLDSVTIRFIGEQAVLGSVVSTGDAHIARELPTAYVPDYQDVDGYNVVVGYQAGSGMQMVFNVRNAPLNIKEFRQALLYAVDADAINDLVFDGYYLAQYGPLNPVHPCVWEGAEEMYQYNPETTMQMLEELGYRDEDGDGIREAHGVPGVEDGTPLTIRWSILHHQQIGETLQAQWRELGIDLVIEQLAGPIQIERVNAADFDLMYQRLRSPDPVILDAIWNSRWSEPGGWAWTGYESEELNALVEQLRTVGDNDARCEIARQAQQFIMEEALMIPTLDQPIIYALSDKIQGFVTASEASYFFLHNTYIAE
jgi:peptide/nickel transport system substrate-binding protein